MRCERCRNTQNTDSMINTEIVPITTSPILSNYFLLMQTEIHSKSWPAEELKKKNI